MKVLIWVLCYFIEICIMTYLKGQGFILGAIPTMIIFGLTILVAKALCEAWDDRKKKKDYTKNTNPPKQNDEDNNRSLH